MLVRKMDDNFNYFLQKFIPAEDSENIEVTDGLCCCKDSNLDYYEYKCTKGKCEC